jgi:hypothetical protein
VTAHLRQLNVLGVVLTGCQPALPPVRPWVDSPTTFIPIATPLAAPSPDRIDDLRPAEIPPGDGVREQHAVEWVQDAIGTRRGSGGWCDMFVANAFGASASGYDTAFGHYLAMLDAGSVHLDDPYVPAGALAFFDATASDGWAGHVMLSIGYGQFVSSDVDSDGLLTHYGSVGVTTISLAEQGSGPYLGWSWAPDAWPGR